MLLKNKNSNENKDIIYKASESTRRAIDSLYVLKASRNRVVIAIALIGMLLGFVSGYISAGVTTKATNNAIELRVSPELKVES